jgi:hypothetical protein
MSKVARVFHLLKQLAKDIMRFTSICESSEGGTILEMLTQMPSEVIPKKLNTTSTITNSLATYLVTDKMFGIDHTSKEHIG